MKDQYVGDVNDFAKYQLLRIAGGFFEPVVVAWMLTDGDGRSDGGKVSYLRDIDSGSIDAELFAGLSELVASGKRSVAAVEASPVLAGCAFHSAPMPGGGMERETYFSALADVATASSLVFLDPDNGLEVASVPKGSKGAERYLYWDEVELLAQQGTSVSIYQHFPRVKRLPYLQRILELLETRLGPGYRSFAAYTPHVGFLFAVREERGIRFRQAVIDRCQESTLLSFSEPTKADQPR